MRKNRKRHLKWEIMPKKMIAPFVVFVILALAYSFIDTKCTQLSQEINRQDIAYKRLENERIREQSRWDEKKTPESLRTTLERHGLAMDYPAATQIVRLDTKGLVAPDQIAVARLKRLAENTTRVVQNPR
jgi:hypothetical protein